MTLKKLAGQTAIYGISHILPRIFNFLIMTVYMTYKFKNPSVFGIFSELYSYATIIIGLMVFRMDTAYFRFASKAEKGEESGIYATTFFIMAFISALIMVAMIVFKSEIAAGLGFPDQQHYVVWFAYILAFDAFTSLIYAKFRLENRPMRFLFYRVMNVFLTVVFIMLFLEVLPRFFPDVKQSINQFFNVEKDLDYVFFSNLLASLLVFVMMAPEFLKINFEIKKSLTREIIKYSWPLVIIIVASSINQNIAVPIQQFLLDGDVDSNKAISGIYSAGAKLAILLNLFTTAFNYAAEPFFFNQAAKDNKHEFNGVIAKAFTIFSTIVILGTYFYIDLILLMIGQNYRGGVVVVPVLLLSYLFLGLYYNISIWYKLADKTIFGAYVAVGGVVVTLVTSVSLIPVIGMMGSAWASLACFFFEFAIAYWLGQKYFPIRYPVKSILGYCTATALLLFLSWVVRQNVDGMTMRLIINSMMMLGFIIFVVVYERPFISKYIKQY